MILDVQNLSFQYPNHPVLDSISFTAKQGKILAILGTNGTGKTTLLKCINQILRPSSGIVYLNKEDASNLKPKKMAQQIGYVDQLRAGYRATVFNTVLLGRKPYIQWDISHNDIEIAGQAISAMDLEPFAMRYINELSGGELQKVVIARALAQEPKVLLMDEPTSCLDLRNQIDVLHKIQQVTKEKNIATIVTMHDLNLALRFADSFILMKDRQIFVQGGPEVITPENIETVYSVPVSIITHLGKLCIIPL